MRPRHPNVMRRGQIEKTRTPTAIARVKLLLCDWLTWSNATPPNWMYSNIPDTWECGAIKKFWRELIDKIWELKNTCLLSLQYFGAQKTDGAMCVIGDNNIYLKIKKGDYEGIWKPFIGFIKKRYWRPSARGKLRTRRIKGAIEPKMWCKAVILLSVNCISWLCQWNHRLGWMILPIPLHHQVRRYERVWVGVCGNVCVCVGGSHVC